GFFGITGNIALLAAIKFRSPASWKSYSILLTNCALIDLSACISSSFSAERMIPFEDITVSVYLGPCVLVSGFACHVLHSIMLHTMAQSLFLIVVAFCYRLYVIGRPPPSPLKMIIFCIIIYLPTFVMLILAFYTNDPPNEVREAFRVLHPDHFVDDYLIEGHVDIAPRPLARIIQAYMILPIVPLLILVFAVRAKV
ncbi:hypothetical protein PFISCL1PPCAC_361, partial [Pristionchus fissidentatus]